ncbi:hypothetical protein B0H17DRAFT_1147957 [Mycena rosella]|uniref:Uncharacterized protein n=1 Tax=Mycena rosella TaxID=1033263 RepID=A0AAD7CH05_MYCRO|nr:hypothetical protein B0H17DRAFT_1147957 [Mycena rosella]
MAPTPIVDRVLRSINRRAQTGRVNFEGLPPWESFVALSQAHGKHRVHGRTGKAGVFSLASENRRDRSCRSSRIAGLTHTDILGRKTQSSQSFSVPRHRSRGVAWISGSASCDLDRWEKKRSAIGGPGMRQEICRVGDSIQRSTSGRDQEGCVSGRTIVVS